MIRIFVIIFIFDYVLSLNSNDTDCWFPEFLPLGLGNSIELYSDDVCYVPLADYSKIQFQWIHTIGESDNLKWSFFANESTTIVGDYDLSVRVVYESGVIDERATIIRVFKKVNNSHVKKNFLAVGDSLTAGGYRYQFPVINNELTMELNPFGKVNNTPYHHEGHSGWRFQTFLEGRVGDPSPFEINGELNFKGYIEKFKFPFPDIVKISLGINDLFGSYTVMETVLQFADTLIELIHSAYDNQTLIVIAMPTTCENTGDGFINNYGSLDNYEGYQKRIREYGQRIYQKYAFGRFHENITVSYDELVIDRNDGYPKDVSGAHTNGVHPNPTGYAQLARGVSNIISWYYCEEVNCFFGEEGGKVNAVAVVIAVLVTSLFVVCFVIVICLIVIGVVFAKKFKN